ncbi:hypothetical protein ACKKBF_B09705 [Auxenochlorella protothecoides x Auxenochlorella symbiontica]
MPGFRIGPFSLQAPTRSELEDIEAASQRLEYNFPHVGSTALIESGAPAIPGYKSARHRVKMGQGRKVFNRGVKMLEAWDHFRLGWAFTNAPPPVVGAIVLVAARSLGLWSCNPLRISRASRSPRRLEFASTTLQGHQICGEEAFSVSWYPQTGGDVWFEIRSVSRPATPLAWLAQPVLRHYQAKFVRESLARMAQHGAETAAPG